MRPSDDRTIPEPSSDCLPRSTSSFTTLGTTFAATCSTEPAGRLAAGTLGAAPLMLDVAAGRSGCANSATPPPMPADTMATAMAPAVKAPARERFWGRGGPGSRVAPGRGRRMRALVGIVGRAKRLLLLLGLVPPVVRLLLVRVEPLRTGVPGCRVLRYAGPTTRWRWRRRIPRVVGHIAAVLFLSSGGLTSRTTVVASSKLPKRAENPLREHS